MNINHVYFCLSISIIIFLLVACANLGLKHRRLDLERKDEIDKKFNEFWNRAESVSLCADCRVVSNELTAFYVAKCLKFNNDDDVRFRELSSYLQGKRDVFDKWEKTNTTN